MKTRDHGPPHAGIRLSQSIHSSRSAMAAVPFSTNTSTTGAGTKSINSAMIQGNQHAGAAGRDHGKPTFGAAHAR